jgi:hypothetical protein
MAKTEAMSIFKANGTDKAELAEAYSAITDQIQKTAISAQLKSQESQISGNVEAGSVIVSRLMIAGVQNYGTARTAGEGDKIKDNTVVVNLNIPKEIVEEVEQWDLNQYGVAGMIKRRATNFALAFAAYMDRVFFTEAETSTNEVDVADEADTYDMAEKLIQTVENVHNDNVDGVDRALIRMTLNTAAYAKLKKFIQSQPNPSEPGGVLETFNGVRVYSNTRQTKSAICMVVGSIAMPVNVVDFLQERVPMSVAQALEMFFKYGIEQVMPDLIFWADFTEVSA